MLTSVKDAAAARRAVLATAKERGVRWVRLAFVDVLGIQKSVSIPVGELEDAFNGKVTFDGGSIDGFVRGEEVDMVLRPDPATFTVLPWNDDGQTEARILCDIQMPDGTPFEGCARTTLKRVLEDAGDVVQRVQAALEVEYYLFELDAEGAPTTRTTDAGSYFDFSAGDRGQEARLATSIALEAMGIPITSAHHEHGAGQHELDLSAGGVLTMADRLVTVRGVVRRIAQRHGLHATFMPKPLEDSAGSGLHIYFALGEVDEVVRLHAISGLLDHAPAYTAVCNPTVNSYKRLVAAWDAPVYTVWSHRSANALVRVPPSFGGEPPLLEVRSPDASCNPYLAMAVLVEALAEGIRARSLPGDPFTGSTYELSERYRSDHGIKLLPKSLRQAIAALDADLVIRGALGDHIYHAFRDAKLAEYERYRRAVHPWERDAYLRVF
ncbi:glutamine synthetase [Vulcanimicrobium alpinum]|uniref:Glutamine synthetase n=1 Tax=Vulcanimicrobium alpinum TaxID=3016050 RepID=A0AAN1XXC0_UNVUL|nr:glutamine synthetase family protein [Vulcanimicrobium alpinum]BDE07130.1 glutamine synthetase [Vulcanimicrobium alpinum]